MPGILIWKNYETKWTRYSGEHNLDTFNKFIRKLIVPSLFEFTEEYIEDVFEQEQPTFILFHDEAKGKPDYWFTYKEAAFNNKGLILFSYVGLTHPYAENL